VEGQKPAYAASWEKRNCACNCKNKLELLPPNCAVGNLWGVQPSSGQQELIYNLHPTRADRIAQLLRTLGDLGIELPRKKTKELGKPPSKTYIVWAGA